MLILVLFPTAASLFILAPEVIVVLAGEKWRPSVPFLQVFAFQAIVRSIFYQCGTVFLALNQPHYNLLSDLVVLATMGAGMFVVVTFELPAVGVACAVLSGYLAGLASNLLLLRNKVRVPLHAYDLVRQALPSVCAAAIMVVVLHWVQAAIAAAYGNTETLPVLGALIAIGAVVYSIAIFLVKPGVVGEVLDLVLVARGREGRFQGLASRRAIVGQAARTLWVRPRVNG